MTALTASEKSNSALASANRVDIGGHAVKKAVRLNGIAARKRKAERSGSVKRDASELLVKWIHGGTRLRPKRQASGQETGLPRSAAPGRASTAASRPGGEPAR